jgi:putative membrane protein
MVIGWNNLIGWVLVFHITGVVMWIGGLFMALAVASTAVAAASSQPGATAGDAGEARGLRARLAQRGMRRLAHPGAALAILSGALLMVLAPGAAMAGWLHAKLLLVALLVVADLVLTVRVRRMPGHEPPAGQIGMFHGIVGLLFFLILVLALVKPF